MSTPIFGSRILPDDPNTRSQPWKLRADEIEFRPVQGPVAVFWNEETNRLRIHGVDAQELISHWIAANVLEIEVVNNQPQ